jgi:hypothetical protein
MRKKSINAMGGLLLLFTSLSSAQEIIFAAARNNNIQLLNELPLKNVTIDWIDVRESAALIIACYNDVFEVGKYFL